MFAEVVMLENCSAANTTSKSLRECSYTEANRMPLDVNGLAFIESSIPFRTTSSGFVDFRLNVVEEEERSGILHRREMFSEVIESVPSIPGALCLLPSVVIVLSAILSQNVCFALFTGLIVGGTLISAYNPFEGFLRAGDTFLYDALQGADQGLLLFTWFMAGLVGVISRNGGALGLGKVFVQYATSARRAQMIAVLVGYLVFFDDYSSILIVGPTMRPVTDACGVSREKLAFFVDSTAAPVASVSILSTWIGFKLSVAQQLLQQMNISDDVFSILIGAIPYSFYPILAMSMAMLVAAMGKDFGPMLVAEQHARKKFGAKTVDKAADLVDSNLGSEPDMEPDPDTPPRAINALIPILSMLVAMASGIISSGVSRYYQALGDAAAPPSAVEILSHAETTKVLIWSSLLADAMAILLTIGQRLLTLEQCMAAWVAGIRSITVGFLTLVFAWGIGNMSTVLHVGSYVSSAFGPSFPINLLPPAAMLISAFVSVASGSSWGTMVLMFPIALPLTVAHDGDGPVRANDSLLATLGAIISGSMFGDHVSPISDTTILSSLCSSCDLMQHVRTQGPYACVVGLISLLLCLISSSSSAIVASMLLPIGILLLALILHVFGSSAEHPQTSTIQTRMKSLMSWKMFRRAVDDENDALVTSHKLAQEEMEAIEMGNTRSPV